MKKIGIIAAMNEEMQEIKNIMKNIEEKNIFNLKIFLGIIEDKECVLVECGIGKVNAARTTQILIDNFEIEFIINIGTAASTTDKLNITDVVIGKSLVQHDFDITAFGHEKGYITGVGRYINSDRTLLKRCEEVMNFIDTDNSYNVHVGTIASGDLFCTDKKVADNIYKEFGAICVEMESAAVAQICMLDNIPFIIIRSISDTPNGNNNIDFDEYLKIASKRGAHFLKEFVKKQG